MAKGQAPPRCAGGAVSNAHKVILSLCDYSGNWSAPYREAGYEVICIDLQHGMDVRMLHYNFARFEEIGVHGILMAPPCTHFASSGARWWATKGEAAIIEGLSIIDACLRTVVLYQPKWWALENPVGRLVHYLGKPRFAFDPCDFGDNYTKRTQLWGSFAPPHPPTRPRGRSGTNARKQDAPHVWQ